MSPDISILIPTYRRPRVLESTLRAIDRMETPSTEFEVIVLDNSPDRESRNIVNENVWSFPCKYLECPKQGKNHALNYGIARMESNLIVCLDDDVSVAEDYLLKVVEGVARWPSAAGYGGRVLLQWPQLDHEVHEKVINYVRQYAYGYLDYQFPEGFFEKVDNRIPVPIENNLILRRSSFTSDKPFEPTAGPNTGVYRMGSGEPLFREFHSRGLQFVYLPEAVVYHRVRTEQLSNDWVLKRSLSYGRSLNHFGLTFRDLSGQSSSLLLIAKWFIRTARQFWMRIRGKDYPTMWAKVDRKLIEGMLYDRWKRR